MMNEEIKNEILAVRETGATNMLDVGTVREIARQLAFDELADFLSDRKNHQAYCKFILAGK